MIDISKTIDIIKIMEINENIFKALANSTRLDILEWLKNPEESFSQLPAFNIRFMMNHFGGVCGSAIVEKSGLAQSTISSYLKILMQADLITAERHAKWTYYRRNENQIQTLAKLIERTL
ncbi:ArsR family (ArsR) [Fructobacillus tropaeoli]|uniref:ArsR family transcriptional regulator n=2 Tax=Lactobacillaceae TaxID=33958 RepID=A0A3F3H8Y5_9LACO|nr:ArsR family transcriptional regulator [Fructobacillus tropaeoli]CAK1247427.1 ArsR family (ArsR) [Fructobacillus tropaeoli]